MKLFAIIAAFILGSQQIQLTHEEASDNNKNLDVGFDLITKLLTGKKE